MHCLIVQPTLKHYRQELFADLGNYMNVTAVGSEVDEFSEQGQARCGVVFKKVKVSRLGFFRWQHGLCRLGKSEKVDSIFIAADAHYLSSLVLTIWATATGRKVYLHGQGLFKNGKFRLFKRLFLALWIMSATRYITYGAICTRSLRSGLIRASKIAEVANRFARPVQHESPRAFTDDHNDGVMFVGRLRRGSKILELIESISEINAHRSSPIHLHIVGDYNPELYARFTRVHWIHFYGHIVNRTHLREIAKHCCLGVYPGKAGLSVLTYMELGLAVLVGDSPERHMGPETTYVTPGVNGWLFRFGDYVDMKRMIVTAITSPALASRRREAYEFFCRLHKVPYAEDLFVVMNRVGEGR